MICPRCTASELIERDHDGVTVDVCRECRGVWLDRGEMEKLIARATRDLDEIAERRPARRPPPDYPPNQAYDPPPRRREDSSGDYDLRYHEDRRRRRKWYESLGDIFD
jgi:Zn-finger nucleic acid-binding protein